MKNFLLFPFCLLAAISTHAQVFWDGGGDGTSWNDAANWAGDVLPAPDSLAAFDTIVTVTGTFSPVMGIRANGAGANVVLDLDISLDNSTKSAHVITVGDSATLTLGVAGNNRTFALTPPDDKHAIAIFGGVVDATLIIAEGTTVSASQGITVINLASPSSSVTNNGTITSGTAFRDAFRVAGTFVNNGSITGGGMRNDLFNVKDGATLTNGEAGTITANAPGDDGIEIISGASVVNFGSLVLTAADDAGSANSGIAVGNDPDTASFQNFGTVSVNGGAGENSRAIYVYENGSLTNTGTITVSGGNAGTSFFVVGSATIDTNAIVDLTTNRINVDSLGTLVNNGFITTDRDGPGIFANGTATNNAFFNYATANSFASGQGTIADNGVSINDDGRTRINARRDCSVDIGNVSYTYFVDSMDYATSNDTGLVNFPMASLEADSVVLTTTIPGVSILVFNICADAVDMSTSIFTATPVDRLALYPTVVSAGGTLTLELGELPRTVVDFQVIDVRGRVLAKQSVYGGSRQQLNIDKYPAGSYTLRAVTGERLLVGRFVVTH